MNKLFIKVSTFIIVCSVLLTGCGSDNNETPDNETKETIVFEYGSNKVSVGEVYIYIKTIKQNYELEYGEDVWSMALPNDDGEEVSVTSLISEEVINEIVKVKSLVENAEKYKVSLSDEETASIEAEATDFYNGLTDDDKEGMELTYDKVYQVMYENILAQQVENQILEDNPIEISDETARMTTFYDMYFNCYTVEADGTITQFTDEQKELQYEKALQACETFATSVYDGLGDESDAEVLAEYYHLSEAAEYTLAPIDIMETYGQEVYDLLYSMTNGEYSTVVETEYGYHVFLMIELTDRSATRENKEKMTEEKTEEFMTGIMDDMRNDIDSNFSYPESVDMELYNSIISD